MTDRIQHGSLQVSKELDELLVSVLQPQGPLFFASIENLINTYITAPKHKMLIIDMSDVTMIDLSGVYALEDLIKNTEANNIKVFVSNTTSHINEVLDKLNFIKNIGKDHYSDSKNSIISIIKREQKLESN